MEGQHFGGNFGGLSRGAHYPFLQKPCQHKLDPKQHLFDILVQHCRGEQYRVCTLDIWPLASA